MLRSRREHLVEQRAVDRPDRSRGADRSGTGRRLGPGSTLSFGKLATIDEVNFENSMRVVEGAEDRAVVEDAVAGAHQRLALLVERAREADARREVVLVDG